MSVAGKGKDMADVTACSLSGIFALVVVLVSSSCDAVLTLPACMDG